MAATGAGWGLVQSGISLGSVFNALASGATAETAAITIPLVTNSTAATPSEANIELVMSASITTASGSPNVQAVWLSADSGANYDVYGVSNLQLFPFGREEFHQETLLPSTAYNVLRFRMALPPVSGTSTGGPILVVYNNTGVAFATTVTATAYPVGSDIG